VSSLRTSVLAAALAVGVFVATSTTDDTGILAGIVLTNLNRRSSREPVSAAA